MNIDLLMNNQAEAVSLSEQGMSITEYLYSFTSSDDAPATMMVNTANGELIRESLESAPAELSQNDVSATDKPQMRVTINDMLTDNDVLLFRAKPKTQGVGIGEALQELLDEAEVAKPIDLGKCITVAYDLSLSTDGLDVITMDCNILGLDKSVSVKSSSSDDRPVATIATQAVIELLEATGVDMKDKTLAWSMLNADGINAWG